MARKKKTIRDEYADGLRRLAFGEIRDAVKLLYACDEQILEELDTLNLYNISEIKRPKGGGTEIKFFDRLKALERLGELDKYTSSGMPAFYAALEEGAKNVWDGSRKENEI